MMRRTIEAGRELIAQEAALGMACHLRKASDGGNCVACRANGPFQVHSKRMKHREPLRKGKWTVRGDTFGLLRRIGGYRTSILAVLLATLISRMDCVLARVHSHGWILCYGGCGHD